MCVISDMRTFHNPTKLLQHQSVVETTVFIPKMYTDTKSLDLSMKKNS